MEQRTSTIKDVLADLRLYGDPEYSHVRLTYTIPHLMVSGVRLLTAHQSKGLEFHTVILTNFSEGHWNNQRKRSRVTIPEHLVFGWEKDQKKFEQHQDERRVAFVAMTRAKRELILTCPREVSVGEKLRAIVPSGFFADMGTLPEEEGVLRDPARASLLLHPRIRVLDGALRGYIEERLKTFRLSPTSLNRFLSDPQEFLMVDLLEQPEQFDESSVRRLGYGSAVHWALRQWAVARRAGKEFSSGQLYEAFAWYLQERTILTDKQRADLLLLGSQSLPRYFEQRLMKCDPFLHAIEHQYIAELNDVPIKGKIDRIDRVSDTSSLATVIDYKAGKGKTESEIRGGIGEGAVARVDDGGHFRQLAFYAVLLEKAEPLLQPCEFLLEYIGERGEDPVTRTFTISDQEKESMRTLIKDVWHKVSSLDFTSI